MRAEAPLLSEGTAPPAAWISEFHYDNAGADADEQIEVMGAAGTDLTGWSIVLYNGNGGGVYATKALSGAIPATCDSRGVVVVAHAGIQNGDPDGIALVDNAGQVVDLFSYDGTFTAVGGAAGGMTLPDIAVEETGSTPAGYSLQRNASGVFQAPAPATFNACNGGPPLPPPPPPPPGESAKVVINELMTDPLAAESASWGEWFEVYNADTVEVNLQGWTIASSGQAAHVIRSAVVIPVGGYAVLGRGHDPDRNGGVTLDYNYYAGNATIWLDGSDWLSLRDPAGTTADSVAWSGASFGTTRAVRDATQDNADATGANWGYSTTPFGAGDMGTPRAPNGTLTSTPPATPTGVARITFSGRNASQDPPLPVGFADQLFATATDAGGNVVETTLTWATTTPDLASVDQDGVVTAKGVGTAVITATSPDGRVGTFQLPTRTPVASTTAVYEGNTEFGEPADGDASDDFIVRRDQFTSSYNKDRGTPNWVSYAIDPSHFGAEDRCDCFTPDPALPDDFAKISTADYTGAGAYHEYPIDRGHLARSFDRTSASLDNATTFYFTNIIPQAADNNQGPWAALEDSLGKLARSANREVYVIAGVAGSRGTVKDEGRIVIPARTWKVAVIMPSGQGLADVDDAGDMEIIAVDMPNEAGIRGVAWHEYETTVDAVERISGYDLLARLPDAVERIAESGDRAPVAAVDGPYTGTEGTAVHFDASGSSDPDGDALTYEWSFGDGAVGSGATPTHTYADNGNFIVRVTVTDPYGAASTATTSVMVVNVAPTVAAFTGETLLRGETYASAGTFADAGAADDWTATVDYGDGSGAQPLALSGNGFTLGHAYAAAGTFTVTVAVTDDDGDTGTRTATVVVQTSAEGTQGVLSTVAGMVAGGTLTSGEGNALSATLRAALSSIERDRPSADNQLRAFINQVEALQGSGRLSAAEAQGLIAAANRVIRSMGG